MPTKTKKVLRPKLREQKVATKQGMSESEADLRRQLAELRAQMEQQVPAAVPVADTSGNPQWYLCPTCQGVGEIPQRNRSEHRKMGDGVKFIDHKLCPTCIPFGRKVRPGFPGLGMVYGKPSDFPGKSLFNIEKCSLCGNYYAMGGGHPLEDPCFQNHAGGSHCHWHDLSMGQPPPQARESA